MRCASGYLDQQLMPVGIGRIHPRAPKPADQGDDTANAEGELAWACGRAALAALPLCGHSRWKQMSHQAMQSSIVPITRKVIWCSNRPSTGLVRMSLCRTARASIAARFK